ncbi:MAG: hypothetical protein ACI9LA_002025, partial [Bacteroidia bacterium]
PSTGEFYWFYAYAPYHAQHGVYEPLDRGEE